MSQKTYDNRRILQAIDIESLRAIAAPLKIAVLQRSKWHFQLSHPDGWLINLYPTTGTVYIDAKRPQPPVFELRQGWTMTDAVGAITDAVDRENCKRLVT